MVVLARSLSNSTPSPLKRALRAYQRLLPLKTSNQDHFTKKPLPRTLRLLRPLEIESLGERYKSGASVYELADEFQISRETVSRHLKAAGVPMRRRSLTPDQIDEAARLYVTGLSVMDIGAALGVHGSTIQLALKRRGMRMRNPWDHPRQRGQAPRR